MALANEILSARFGQLLTRLFRILGGNPAPQLAPEVMPVVDLIEPPDELRYLLDEYLAWAVLDQAGTAGKNAHVTLCNPFGSGILLTLEHINAWSAATLEFVTRIMGTSTPPPVSQIGRPRDLRIQKRPVGYLNGSNDYTTLFAASLVTGDFFDAVGGAVDIDFPIVLGPGDCLILEAGAVNTELIANFVWRERPMEPSEDSHP